MDLKVILKDTFLADLENILRVIATQNPGAAQKVRQQSGVEGDRADTLVR